MGYLRRLPRFEYVAPRTVEEVCSFLAERGGEARLFAGGTDLVLQMKRREIAPRLVIGLKGIAALASIRSQPGGIAIGAMATFGAIESSSLVRERHDFLCATAAGIGSPEIRAVATIGGNLSGALPCADFPAPLMTLGARVRLKSARGERSLALEDFFKGFAETAAASDEILTEIEIPSRPDCAGGAYVKFHDRHAMDMTTTGVAAFVTWDREKRVAANVRIALSVSGPVPLRAKKAEAALSGERLTDEALAQAALLACQEARPRASWRARREFREELINVLTQRALRQAGEKARAAAERGNA
jgi:aerobic carbon-monoxide dehydrogenase medium subunit